MVSQNIVFSISYENCFIATRPTCTFCDVRCYKFEKSSAIAYTLPSYSLFFFVSLEEFPFFRAANKRGEQGLALNRRPSWGIIGLPLTVFVIWAGFGDYAAGQRCRVAIGTGPPRSSPIADNVFSVSVGQHHFCLFRLQFERFLRSLPGSSLTLCVVPVVSSEGRWVVIVGRKPRSERGLFWGHYFGSTTNRTTLTLRQRQHHRARENGRQMCVIQTASEDEGPLLHFFGDRTIRVGMSENFKMVYI